MKEAENTYMWEYSQPEWETKQEMRMAHLQGGPSQEPEDDVGRPYSMDDVVGYSPLMKQLLPLIAPTWDMKRVVYMKILCDEYTYVDDLEDIEWQPLLAPLVDGKGSDTVVRVHDCTYVLGDADRNTLVMHVQYKGENKRRIIFRLTVVSDELNMRLAYHNFSKAPAQTMMICIDKRKEDQLRAEFRYMRDDARDKMWKRMEEDMTAAQRISTLSEDDEIMELLYVGTKAFLDKQFAQALIPLRKAYKKLDARYDDFNSKKYRYYLECLYMMGYSLDELGQYEQAHYYLQMIPFGCSVEYDEEFLCCMLHLNDRNLISILEIQRRELINQMHWDAEDADKDYTIDYYAHMFRVLIDAYIENGQYARAEQLLKEEIKDCRNVAYAEAALMRIRSEKKLSENKAN